MFELFRFNHLNLGNYLPFVFVHGNILTTMKPRGFNSTLIHHIIVQKLSGLQ